MRSILLPNGKLLVPVEPEADDTGEEPFREIGPEHPDYGHWLALSQPGEDPRKGRPPSIFLGALAGYAIATLAGVVVLITLFLKAGCASATAGLDLLVGAGAMGVLVGHWITARRRKALGIRESQDDWAGFARQKAFFLLVFLVIAGSFGLAMLIKWAVDGFTRGAG